MHDGVQPFAKTPGDEVTLGLPPGTVRDLGYRIVDMIVEELADPERRPVFLPAQSRAAMELLFGGPVPRAGMDPEELLAVIQDHLLRAAGNPNHPRLMAYVLSASQPLASLLEALVGTIKLRPTTWKNQPASCQIELTVTRWLGEMVGFAPDAAGYVTTGGSWANLIGLAVARTRRAGWDVRAEGVANRPPLVAYVSEQAHACIDRSAELLGLGQSYLKKIPVDDTYRIRLDVLEETIQADRVAGYRPFCLIGNAGTVNTGAYGAFSALTDEARELFTGLERADSLTLDPHKWLNTPFEAGCILTKAWDDLGDTFSLIPPYLRGAMGAEHNQYEYGFELSRTDRALKVWLALHQYGADCYTELIASHLALARHLAALVDEADDFELVSAPVLSICCFRFVPSDLDGDSPHVTAYLNRLNQAVEIALASDGRALVSGTELNGKRVLRACIVSHPVTQASVEETLCLLRHYGHERDAQMRQQLS